MRKTLTALALTAALTGGSAAVATTAYAAAPQGAPVVSQTGGEEPEDGKESDKTGLWGLLGLLGLAGLLKKKQHTETHTTGTAHR
jgi:MYXO-CTERM domain-containing protein